jgi:hypothetical protein
MKKTIFLLCLTLLSIPVMSQGKEYTKVMQTAMEKMNEANGAGELEVAADLEKIAQDYPDQWLPSYHAARILITASFMETEIGQQDALLDRAKKWMLQAENMVPEESEVQVLKALYYTGLISAEPDTRGPIYYQDAMDAIQKGLDLNPDNPRAHYMNASWTLNSPEFLGGGPEAARPLLLEAQQKFKDYENEDPFWPAWGEDWNQAELDRIE